MQDSVMQVQAQPFVKLAQANMDLITRFSTSSEITSQATEAAMKLMHSGAFMQLMQGMLKNYTEFVSELSQGSMAMLAQSHALMTRQVQEATHDGVAAADVRGRRARHAA